MKSKKNRTMKTFEEIYRDAAVRNGCNAGKTFARVMFEEGKSQNLERCMDRAAGSHTDLMAYAGWFGKRRARAGRQLSSGPSDDLKTLLKEAVLTGFDLQKDDFDED